MLSCWNESPRLRPSFVDLKATFDSLLLAGRKDDYIEFSFDTMKLSYDDQLEGTSELSSFPGLVGVVPGMKRQSCTTPMTPGDDECTLLLPGEKPQGNGQLRGNSSTNSSPRLSLSPRKWPSRQQSPRQCSPGSTGGRQSYPGERFSPNLQSPKKQGVDASSVAPQRSSLLLFPGRRSPRLGSGSISPQGHSPCHSVNPLAMEVDQQQQQQQERHRPISLFSSRDQEGERERERKKKEREDRYVKEPTKLANLNQSANHSSVIDSAPNGAPPQQLHFRSGSEGTLNMNSDGYVSFVGMDHRDRRADPPPSSADIQITVTEDL